MIYINEWYGSTMLLNNMIDINEWYGWYYWFIWMILMNYDINDKWIINYLFTR